MSKKAVSELTINATELLIDQLSKNPLVKDIPIVNTIIKCLEIGVSVRDHFFAQKLALFLECTKSVSESDYGKIKKFASNKSSSVITSKILQVIDAQTDNEKAEIIAVLFLGYIDKKLTTSEFKRALDTVNYQFLDDILAYVNIWSISDYTFHELNSDGISSLINSSLFQTVEQDNRNLIADGRENEVGITKYEDSDFGEKFRAAFKHGRKMRML